MSAAEQVTSVFDPSYWYPYVADGTKAMYYAGEQEAVIGAGKGKEKAVAEALESTFSNGRSADRELRPDELIDIEAYAIGSVIRFKRELLTVASHVSNLKAYALVGKEQMPDRRLVGEIYHREPDHDTDYEAGVHTVLQYELQEGLGIVMRRKHTGANGLFGVEKVKQRTITDPLLGAGGVPFYSRNRVEETFKYKYRNLRLPLLSPAHVGVATQLVRDRRFSKSVETVTKIERINQVEVFDPI